MVIVSSLIQKWRSFTKYEMFSFSYLNGLIYNDLENDN